MSVLVNAQQRWPQWRNALGLPRSRRAGASGEITGVSDPRFGYRPGIPPSVLPHIFDTFFSTRGGSEGLGLG